MTFAGFCIENDDINVIVCEFGLGNFGGLLGLCVGFSLMSIIEIVYFVTVRLYQNITSANNSKQSPQMNPSYYKTESFDDRKIREMYVNDYRTINNRQYFHSRY